MKQHYSPLKQIKSSIVLFLFVLVTFFNQTKAFTQCPIPANDGNMATTGSGFNPATSLAPFLNFGSEVAGADETIALIYINTVNQFDIPSVITSVPPTNTSLVPVFYNGNGQQLIGNFGHNSGISQILLVKGLEPNTAYYFQTVKVSRCGSTYTINSTIESAMSTSRGTSLGLSESTTVKDVVFGTSGVTNIPLNSWTGITSPTIPTGYVVKMNTINSFTPITDLTDPNSLTADTAWQDSGEQIVYVGNSTTPNIDITGLASDTDYYFKIYGYYNNYYQEEGHTAIANTSTARTQASITLTGGTTNNITASIGDGNITLGATSNSSSSLLYQLVEAPGFTSIANNIINFGNSGTIIVDIIAPGDATYTTSKERITITVNKIKPTLTLQPFTVKPSSETAIPFTTTSNGEITYSIVGAANGSSLTGLYNSTYKAGTTPGATLIRASVSETGQYESGSIDAYITTLDDTAFFTTDSKLITIAGGSTTTLVDFSTNAINTGSKPFIIKDIGNRIWGVTTNGGTNGKGVVFMVDKDGSNFTKVGDFAASGASAYATSIKEINGKVYGSCFNGGAAGKGEIWSANTDGTGYAVIHTFTATGLQFPAGDLIDYNGKLYGVASNDTNNSRGGVFSMDYDGSNFVVEYLCDTTDSNPEVGLTQFNNLFWWSNSANKLFGWNPTTKTRAREVTSQGSYNYPPTIVENEMYIVNSSYIEKVTNASSTTLVHTFTNASDVSTGWWELFYDNERLWGTSYDATSTNPVVYSLLPDGTDFKQEWKGTTAEQPGGNVIRPLEKVIPVLTFADQTVDHLSITTLAAASNSTSSVTYELINDTTGSVLSGSQFTAGNAGTVTIRASVAGNSTFEAANTEATFIIQKLDPTFVKSDLSLRLDQSPFTIVPDETNYVGGTITYQFVDPSNTNNLSSNGFTTASALTGNQLTLTGIGTETIRATLPESANYNAKTVDFQLTIVGGQADLSGFVDFEVELFQSDVTLSVSSDSEIAVRYEMLTSNTGSSLSGADNQILTVGNILGTETIRVTVTEPNYAPATKDITLTLAKAIPVITWATPADVQAFIEPLDAARLNASANVPGTFEYRIEGALITEGVTTINTIGSSTLVAHFTPTDAINYRPTTFDVVINATKVNLEITIDDKSIIDGATEPTLTYTITNGAIIPGHTLFFPITREAGTAVGTYAITVDNAVQSPQLDDDGNPVCSNGLCIYGPAVFGGTGTKLTFYNLTVINGTFSIAQKPQVTASDIPFTTPSSLVYDGKAKIYSVIPDAALNPTLPIEDIEITYEGRNGTAYPSTTTAPTNVGDYIVTTTVKDSNLNYGGSIATDFSITPIAIEVTVDALSKIYGDVDPSLSYQITSGSLISGDVLTGNLERVTGDNVGDYAINQGTLDNTNYTITFLGNNLTITTRAITVTADDVSKNEFTPDPSLTYQITTGSLAFSDVFSGSITRQVGETDGTYAINQGTLALNANYNITFINGLFTIINGAQGAALHFNGSADNNYDYITVPDTNDLDFTTAYSFEAWVNFDQTNVSTSGYGWRCIHAKSRYADSYGLMVNAPTKLMRFYHKGMGVGYTDYTWSTLTPNTWYHVAVTLSATEAKIYINGTEVSNNTFAAGTLVTNSEPLYIGASRVVASDPYPFDGIIDEVRVWSTTRTASEIDNNKDVELTGNETGLVLNYQFNQGGANVDNTSITAVIDHSVNGYNGTFNQFALTGSESNFVDNSGVVVKSDQIITFNALADKTYGDSTFDLTASSDAGLDVTYVSSNTSVATISGNTVTIVGAGTTSITVSQAGNRNYNPAVDVTQNLTVNKANQNITFNALADKVYGDSTFDLTASSDAGLDVTYVSSNTSVATISDNTVTIVGAGTTVITASQSGNTNVNAATNATQTLTVSKRTIEVTADAKTKVFGETDPTLTYQITSGSLVSGDAFVGILTRVSGENAGTYAIQQDTFTAGANYNLVYVSNDLTITKRIVEITTDAKTKTYGDTDPALTYQLTSGTLINSDAFSGVLERVTGEDVGSYTINQGTVTLGANYTINFVTNNLTITKRNIFAIAEFKTKTYGDADPALTYRIVSGSLVGDDAFSGTLTRLVGENIGTYTISQGTLALNNNYNLNVSNNTLSIFSKPIEITGDAKTKTYGDTDPILTYQITSGALINSDVLSGNLERTTGEDVGTYIINLGSLGNSNYNITYISADFEISKKTIEITADVKTKEYGATDPSLTYQITSGNLVNSDAFTGSLERVSGESVGTYAINQGTLALSANYNVTFVSNDFTISQIALEITADAKSKEYGNLDQALTYQVTSGNLVNSDVLIGSLERVSGEDVGTYTITQGTLNNTNYVITFISADYTITKKNIYVAPRAESKIYGEADPVLTYSTIGPTLVSGDTFTGSLTRDVGENVGNYAITQGTLALSNNYTLNMLPGILIINPRPIEVSADAKSKVYGGTDPSLTYQITSGNLVNSDVLTGNLERAVGEDVGAYAITQGALGNSNYDITFIDNDLTISKKSISILLENKVIEYGDAEPILTYIVVVGALESGDAFTGNLERAPGNNIGSYAITQGTLTLTNNYNVNIIPGNVIIQSRPIEVTADPKTKIEGTIDPVLTYQITSGNLVNSDVFTGSLSRTTGETVGNYTINLGSLDLGTNYDITYIANTFTITRDNLAMWDGSTNSIWTEATNWSGDVSPLATDDYIIPNVATTPEITSNVQVNDLEIESLSSFDISADGSVVVDGDFINNGTIIINSTTATSGTLIVKGSSNGQVTYERGGLKANVWSIVSAPVLGQSIKDFVENTSNDIRKNTSVTPNRYAVGYYDDSKPAGSKWIYYTTDDLATNTLTFEAGKSYAISRATDGSVTFTGTVITTDVPKAVTASEWNAVGNPYTAFMPINENSGTNFINENLAKFDPVNIGVYVWDNSQSKYVGKSLVTDEASLAPGQGFFVKTATRVNNVMFNQAQRMTQPLAGGTFSRGFKESPSIQLQATLGKVTVDTNIKYFENATLGLDPGYDLGNYARLSFDVYTRLVASPEGEDFTIQSLPLQDIAKTIIPIGVKAASGSSITFSVKHQNLPEGLTVFIEDKKLNAFIELNADEVYTVEIDEKVNGVGRFYLHTKSSELPQDVLSINEVKIYNVDNTTLIIEGIATGDFDVQLYNTVATKVMEQTIQGQGKNIITLPTLQSGVYIVRISTALRVKSKKIIIK